MPNENEDENADLPPPGSPEVRRAVLSRLAAVERVAGQVDPSALLPLARTELCRLAESWRRLLSAHRMGPDGRCEACRTGIRARRWPCQVWRSAHEQLIGEGLPHRRRTRPLRSSFYRQGGG